VFPFHYAAAQPKQARFATFVFVILKLVPLHGNCVKQNDWMSNEQGLDTQTCHAICDPRYYRALSDVYKL